MKPILIGIAGGSASGKTSIARKIKETFQVQSVSIIREDDYYKDQSELTMEQRVKTNYDHPLAFDTDLMIHHLKCLMMGQSIDKPTYDFTIHTRSDKVEKIPYSDVIIVEGLFVLENAKLRDLLDIKIFVDTASDVRFIRRLIRDVNERERTLESVVNQYMNVVRVMHEQFIEPTKKNADLIIPEGGENIVAIDLLCTKISRIIEENVL